jgi:hypothetical protein
MPHWYIAAAAVAAAILLWIALGEQAHQYVGAIIRLTRPKKPPPPREPAVVLDRPAYDISTAPLHERLSEQDNSLLKLTIRPRPLRNNEATMTIREITVGARRRGTETDVELQTSERRPSRRQEE